MEVKKIGPIGNSNGVKTTQSVSFGGAEKLANGTAQKLSDAIVHKMPSCIKIMEKLRCLKGEAGGIIINSIGTGLVAPIFIAFNPLSKADEKTKKYTAMRQPVSAVLAVLIQAGLIKPLNMLYDYMINSGTLGKSPYLDKSNLHDEAYFIKEYKKSGQKGLKGDEYVYAQRRMNDEIKKVVKQLEEDGTIIFSDNKKLSDKDVIRLIEKTLESYKKGAINEIKKSDKTEFSVKRAQLLINPKNQPKITELCDELLICKNKDDALGILKKYLSDSDDDIITIAKEFNSKKTLEEMQHRAASTLKKIELFQLNLQSLDEIKDNSEYFITHLNKILKAKDSEIDNLINELENFAPAGKKNKIVGERFKTFNEFIDVDSKKAYAKILIDRLEQLKQISDDKLKMTALYQRAYYSDLKLLHENQLKVIDSLKPANKTVVNITETIKSLKNRVKGFNKSNFTEDMVNTWKKCVDSRVKGYKQITNILFGLIITLPVTCHALNWVYPRFMDIFFPHLSKNDKCAAPEEKAKVKGGK